MRKVLLGFSVSLLLATAISVSAAAQRGGSQAQLAGELAKSLSEAVGDKDIIKGRLEETIQQLNTITKERDELRKKYEPVKEEKK